MVYLENKAKHRYYMLQVQQDLFGAWCLVKLFGSTVSNRCRKITQACNDKDQALLALFDVESKKRQRGYAYADHP